MSAIIASQQAGTGSTLYAIVRDSLGQVANGTTLEAYNVSNYATYVISMAEQAPTGYFKASFPSYLSAGRYSYSVHLGSGVSGDPAVDSGSIDWSGSIENYLGQITTKLPSGSISGFDPTAQSVNLNSNQSGVTVGTVNSLGTSAAASVKTQIDASVGSDAISELSGVPASVPTLKQAIMFLYMALRNKRTTDAGSVKIYNASGSAIASAVRSDNGVTGTKENFT